MPYLSILLKAGVNLSLDTPTLEVSHQIRTDSNQSPANGHINLNRDLPHLPTLEENLRNFGKTAEGPLPIVIGVTGHRDLREGDIPTLESLVKNIFTEFRNLYPSTPLLILTALAEGADRLFARSAMELDLRVVSVLPMDRKLYEQDFGSEESKREFHQLLQKSEHYFELPLLEGYTTEMIDHQGHERDMQYAQVGAYVAAHSQILVALWDGLIRDYVGGTSQVVHFQLEGIPEPFAPPHSALDAVESGPVYHVITPRKINPVPIGEPLTLLKRFPPHYESPEAADHAFHEIFDRMNGFNRDALDMAKLLAEDRKQSEEYVLPGEKRKPLGKSLIATLDFYGIADTMSIYYQTHFFKALKTLLVIVFAAAVFFNIFTFIAFDDKTYLITYLAIFLAAFGWHSWAARKSFQSKYLDYRALAEGLRIQFFWELGGLRDSVADYYLRKQKSELDWIRHAIRITMTQRGLDIDAVHRMPIHHQKERLQLVLTHWVADQAKYFTKSAFRDNKNMEKHGKKITAFFVIGLGLSITQLFISPSAHLMMFASLAPVTAALMHSWAEKKALSEHSKQYERMSILFNRAKQHMEELLDADRIHEAQRFLVDVGKEALIENGDWIMTHRERPLEVPK